jgi:Electron transfer DM13
LFLLNFFGSLENFIADDLYPYRYVITPLLLLATLAAIYFAYAKGVHLALARRKLTTALVGVPVLVVAVVVGNYLLSPLWERSYANEASPLAVAEAASDATQTPSLPAAAASDTTFEARVVQSGEFSGSDDFHFGHGDAQLIETAPGVFTLRFENFSVRNGPDLYVYLSEDPSGESVEEALNLGSLKATDGAFNYEIPANIDVSGVKSAVVWCKQFSVLFAHAELE